MFANRRRIFFDLAAGQLPFDACVHPADAKIRYRALTIGGVHVIHH